MEDARFTERFGEYFRGAPAELAARSLASGAEIEFRIRPPSKDEALEIFTFGREGGSNRVTPGPAPDPQLTFELTPLAAESILTLPDQDIGRIGIHILTLVAAGDASRKVSVKFHAGFLTLLSKGYLGVLSAGGAGFASALAARGLGGVGAIQAALKKARK
jgi:hypothetical protein